MNKHQISLSHILLATVVLSLSLPARATLINFDDYDSTEVEGLSTFYEDRGVIFPQLDWRVFGGLAGINPSSPPLFIVPQYGNGWVNIPGGFTAALRFTYGTQTSNATVNVFDGLFGQGTLLASIDLPDVGTSSFTPVAIKFEDTAYSFTVDAGSLSFGLDDLEFSNDQHSIPAPATFTLVCAGLALFGARRKGAR